MQHRYDEIFAGELGMATRAASQVAANAASPAERKTLRGHARQIRFSRDLRRELFNRNLFGEPAWDILLALYVIDSEQRRLSTREVADLANQPLTTVLRWLDYLVAQNLVSRRPNPFDQRALYIELSDKGRATMDEYLTKMHTADMFGPIAISEQQPRTP